MADHGEFRIKVGVSACLLGQRVRYDGGDKLHRGMVGDLGRHVTWVPVCPEAELGLGVPREPIELVARAAQGGGHEIRLVATRSGRDLTEPMQRFADGRLDELAAQGIAGFVFKSLSPSCGLARVKVFDRPAHDPARVVSPTGRGVFAAALAARFPDMPVVEEHELDTPEDRARFLQRVRTYRHSTRGPAPG